MCHVSHVINETKSPAYGRHWISWHVQIISPKIRLGRSCFLMFYSALLITDPHPTSFTTLEKKWNEKHLPKSVFYPIEKNVTSTKCLIRSLQSPPFQNQGGSPLIVIYTAEGARQYSPFLYWMIYWYTHQHDRSHVLMVPWNNFIFVPE